MSAAKRRVVVTGLGLVTPLGIGAKHVWKNLLAGNSGVTSLLPLFPGIYDKLPVTIAGVVPRSLQASESPFIPSDWLQPGGPNHSTSTACTTGAHSIGDAARFIEYGDADIMIAGASESPIDPLAISGFNKIKALTQLFNNDPQHASRPFDSLRSGFVIGEGSGVVVLEELEHAKSRNANIYAELKGYGLSGDANHITLPSSDGRGARRSMSLALQRAGLQPIDVDYINAHATSTPIGDMVEMKAIESLFNLEKHDAQVPEKSIAVSSTKSSIGHLLGAAGSVEAIFTILAVKNNIAPPTLNLECLDSVSTKSDTCQNSPQLPFLINSFISGNSRPQNAFMTDIEYLSSFPMSREINVALSNSFGFGGTNASLVFTKYV
ncbi:3-oxoacyl-[acyl-carrier-protein] synthase 2 [Smittium culicis]|uniref:beta-ketoacyl-[acyl-carrier-protein] synthase I n=1 Tax=Smittium culicis TaxID=133412 RepID=A0A1R1YHE2_9FUNG|nr:3-oxoacyl-[acyl-carrier-protein] synthase 2 [Smittium culicis]